MPEPARTTLVTGGSRGLGLGIARQLASAGYRVIAIARTLNKNLSLFYRSSGTAIVFQFFAQDFKIL